MPNVGEAIIGHLTTSSMQVTGEAQASPAASANPVLTERLFNQAMELWDKLMVI